MIKVISRKSSPFNIVFRIIKIIYNESFDPLAELCTIKIIIIVDTAVKAKPD